MGTWHRSWCWNVEPGVSPLFGWNCGRKPSTMATSPQRASGLWAQALASGTTCAPRMAGEGLGPACELCTAVLSWSPQSSQRVPTPDQQWSQTAQGLG